MKTITFTLLLILTLFSGGCASGRSFEARLSSVVSPYRFSITSWEVRTFLREAQQGVSNLGLQQWFSGFPTKAAEIGDEAGVVIEYFETVKRIKTLQSKILVAGAGSTGSVPAPLEEELRTLQEKQAAQAAIVEQVIEGQVRAALAGEGIFNPVGKGTTSFPPLNFKLEELPSVLVISPRDRIESAKQVVLNQGLTLAERESIESGADKLGVSSLVVGIGGLATYPSLIDNEAGLRWTLETAAHEWLHQYLAFKPLGFRYLLDLAGVSKNYDIATMNESVAGMAGKEIGDLVYEKYYSGYEVVVSQAPATGFDFNAEMREIRKTIDVYLASGEIDRAEAFMEQKRQELASKGYYIRKLNQAYFAFHGTYADGPAFLNPIGLELKGLRSKSASLKEFLDTVDVMTSRQDLTESLK